MHRHIPVILVTAKSDPRDVVEGLDAGGDDYLTKPIDHAALLARVRSMLRIKALHDTVQDQARELAAWNRLLEQRVTEQVEQIGRMERLRRFLPPQVADLLVAGGEAAIRWKVIGGTSRSFSGICAALRALRRRRSRRKS